MSKGAREQLLLGSICLAVLALVPVAARWQNGPLAALERFSLDERMRRFAPPGSPAADIAIIHLDDRSINLLAPRLGAWPWPRNVHAAVIDFLARGGARAIVFDILFLEPHACYPAGDDELIAATRRAGRVYHVVGLEEAQDYRDEQKALGPFTQADPGGFAWPAFKRGKRPLAGLAEASRGVLATNLVQDADGVLRRTPTLVRLGERVLPTVSWGLYQDLAALNSAAGSLLRVPRDRQGQARLVYFPATAPYEHTSFRDVLISALELQQGKTPTISPATFSGKVVFIGLTARGLRDEFDTPIRPEAGSGLVSWPLFGVEVHAEAFDLLRQGRLLRAPRDVPAWLMAALALLVLVFAGVLECSLHLKPAGAVLTLLAGATVLIAGGGGAYRYGLVAFPLAAPLAGLALVWSAGTVRALVRSLAARRQVQDLFGRYLAPAVVKRLLENDAEAALGGTRRVITILFSDIRGFTSWSEARAPEAVVRQLNEYLSAMSEVVAAHGGYVDKFIGDAVMALWGVPLFQEDHADRGLAAARAMLERLAELNREWEAHGLSPFKIGIGLNSGEAVVGNLGSTRKADYTAIGDPVNTASRLEGMNKELKTTLLVSKPCREALRTVPGDLRSLGQFPVRGREALVELFTL